MTPTDEVTVMYHPIGPKERDLLRQAGFKRWPPRLPDQPIFYPVTNEQYAAEIASNWNVRDSAMARSPGFRCGRRSCAGTRYSALADLITRNGGYLLKTWKN